MAIPHAEPGDVIDVRPLGPALAGARSHALFKSNDLEVIRLVLRTGQGLPPHGVSGEITLQCLEGRISFSCAAVRFCWRNLASINGLSLACVLIRLKISTVSRSVPIPACLCARSSSLGMTSVNLLSCE